MAETNVEPSPPPGTEAGPYRGPVAPARRVVAPPLPLRVRELAGVAALIVIADVTLVGAGLIHGGGVGLALAFGLAPMVLLATARTRRVSARLLAVGALLALVALRCAADPTPLTGLCGLGLLVAFAVGLRTPRLTVERLLRSTGQALVAHPHRWMAAVRAARALRPGGSTTRSPVRWAAVAVPVAVVLGFVGLFALANPIVESGLGRLLDGAISHSPIPSVTQVAVWGFAAVLGLALVRPSVSLMTRRLRVEPIGEPTPTRAQVARNTLVGVNLLFLGYNALELWYVAVGQLPGAMTTQQYARHGAFWLTVALALLTAVVSALLHGPLAHAAQGRAARRLAMLWVGQGLLVAASTYWRIGVHVGHSGLSNLRIVGILGTSLVVIGLVLVAIRIQRQRTLGWLLTRQADAAALFVVVFAIAPTHFISTRVNVQRVQRGEAAPLLHLRDQSKQTEAVAELVPLLGHPDPRVRAGVSAFLDRERQRLRATLSSRAGWTEHDIWTHHALATLERAAPEIDGERPEDPVLAMNQLEAMGYDEPPLWLDR